MGRKLVLTGTKLTDTTAPKLVNIDPLESAGSLLLIDPTHPTAPWAAGVPADRAAVPNVLASHAAALGITSAPTLRNAGWTGAAGRIERTTRGGLHGIVSPTAGTAASYMSVAAGTGLRAYLLANPGHAYYMSTWHRITRAASGTTRVHANISANVGAGTNYLMRQTAGGSSPSGRTGTSSAGLQFQNTTATSWTGTAPTNTDTLMLAGFYNGNSPYAYDDTLVRKAGSGAYYRFYVEDLTVSGRSYAEVDALDYALYQREVLTEGGRYYGDTFTDPATVA